MLTRQMGLVLLIRDIYSRTLELGCMQQNAKNAQKELFLMRQQQLKQTKCNDNITTKPAHIHTHSTKSKTKGDANANIQVENINSTCHTHIHRSIIQEY